MSIWPLRWRWLRSNMAFAIGWTLWPSIVYVCNTTYHWFTFSLERLTRLNGKCYGSNYCCCFLSLYAHAAHRRHCHCIMDQSYACIGLLFQPWCCRGADARELWPSRLGYQGTYHLPLSPLSSFAGIDCHSAISCRRILCTMVWSLSTVCTSATQSYA